ncbi:MAG: 3-hydroxyacyl-CoA dehydrogenase family protein [Candidatus Paracaedibacteraceae bacterium]|nr:3-hydroxyacyl-CoA dehydrogenase family protein [Candidatus Paracaedibacteraceae bacterium]
MTAQNIGIIGAGQMGQGIAEVLWLHGHTIYLFDADPVRLELAYQKLRERLESLINKGLIATDFKNDFLDRLRVCVHLSYMSTCTLIIEAIIENVDVKAKLFSDLSKIVDNACVLATNTSSISITKLAQHVVNSSRFLGIHFFNPVHRMPLIEMVPHQGTSLDVIEYMKGLIESVGKIPIRCADSPGFVVNRLLIPMINQAARLVQNNIAKPEDIDLALKLGANFPMGPLALADFIGLDTCVSILTILAKDCDDASYVPTEILLDYVRAGKMGVKSKEGFFKYV